MGRRSGNFGNNTNRTARKHFLDYYFMKMKTLDSNYFYNILDNANYNWDVSRAEEILENDLEKYYECKNYDYNYRKNSFLQSFEDLFRVIQQCTYFIKGKPMEDLLIQAGLYLEELLNNNREQKKQLERDTNGIIEAYENKIEQEADYYAEMY